MGCEELLKVLVGGIDLHQRFFACKVGSDRADDIVCLIAFCPQLGDMERFQKLSHHLNPELHLGRGRGAVRLIVWGELVPKGLSPQVKSHPEVRGLKLLDAIHQRP